MKLPPLITRAGLAAALLLSLLAPAHAALPSDSLFQLDTGLTDSAQRRFTLRDMAGAPLLLTMFYGDCHTACPIVIETLKRSIAALGPSGRNLRVLLVSLDPAHDTPATLAHLAALHKLDAPQFRLALAGGESQTRLLAGALDIKYRAMDDGQISHTTRIVLLDGAGRVLAASTQLAAEPDPAFLRQIGAALAHAAP